MYIYVNIYIVNFIKNQTQAVKVRYSFYLEQKKMSIQGSLKILPLLKSVLNEFRNQQLHVRIVLSTK